MASAPLAEGDYLLHYRLLGPVGAGGMGVVWRALDTRLNREVALKLLPSLQTDEPQQTQRLTREAQCASALNHPNIVTIYDINSDAGRHFIAMELVRGKSLRELLRERRLDATEAIRYAIQLCDALAKAHAAGIIHRDLKPGNVMITGDGLVKVLDFGLAKPVGETGRSSALASKDLLDDDSLTTPGAVLGTVGYMSPEQTLGGDVDARSDVFSFGVVLYEMLSGYRPFPGASRQEVALNLLRGAPQPLHLLCPGVPHLIEEIVNRCLAREAANRYTDCGAVVRELRVAAEELPANPPSVAPGEGDTTIFDEALGTHGSGTGRQSVQIPPRASHAFRWVAAILLLVVVVVAGLAWRFYARPALKAQAPRGIAVLPFTPVGSEDRTRAFGVGLVMSLSSQLSALEPFREAFWVVPPGDVLQAKALSAKEARQMFGVDLVISGSVEATGNRIRVTAIVSDAKSQRMLRSGQMTEAAADSFALQDDLVSLVAQLLQVGLPVEVRATAASFNSREPGAEDYYVQGRGYLLSDANQADLAIAVFKEALRRDPAFAKAYAGLGEAYLDKYEFSKDPDWINKARASCEQALKLRPRNIHAQAVLGNIARIEGRYDEAVSVLRTIVTQEPKNLEAWLHLARTYESKQALREAEAAYQKAVEIQPSYPGAHQHLGSFYYKQGRYDEAARSFKRASELAPDNYKALNNLSAVLVQQGHFAPAEVALRHSLEIRPNPIAYNNLASLYFTEGRYAESVPMMEQAVKMGQRSATLLSSLAHLYRLVPELRPKAAKASADAIDVALRQIAVNPHDAEARADLAWLYAEQGERQSALREISAALKEAPESGFVLFRLVLVNELLGDRKEALVAYDSLAKTGSLLTEVNHRPELKALRNDPKFKEKEWQTTQSHLASSARK
jgi:serine/threonine-protein kinase